jgi:phosphoribosylaminoimidazolecarboxamide formyltransferase / IMP cyclohydrolase
MKKIAVLISNGGTGTNLQGIIDAIEQKKLPAEIALVVSDTEDAYGLVRAQTHNIKTAINKNKSDLLPLLLRNNVEYVALAGWKQFLTKEFIDMYENRILNLHPGLIPDTLTGYALNPDGTNGIWNKGKFTDKALQNFFEHKATYAGSSIHFLTHEFDFGPVLGRCFEKIKSDDTIESLYARLKQKENQLYVEVLQKICNSPMVAEQQEKYALLSVYNKVGIAEFATTLQNLGYRIISTGGTAKALLSSGIPVLPIEYLTGNPESFDGRMKTISFQVESGILYDRANEKHVAEAQALSIKPIDIVVCNLYPFEETIGKPGVTKEQAVESIDVGGPTMVRSAAKNFKNVLIVVDPSDYSTVAEALETSQVTSEMKQNLAAKAFGHLSFYDSQIASYLQKDSMYPNELTLPGRKVMDLRYGENPHQTAALYLKPNTSSIFSSLKKQYGRDLSLTNVSDINAGVESVRLFKEPAAVVIKHNTPCGIAYGKTSQEALSRAIEADPESAFGGVIVLNHKIDSETAQVIGSFKDDKKGNIDIVSAPWIDPEALAFLQSVRKSMGIYTFGEIPKVQNDTNLKWVDGGYIVQSGDYHIEEGFKKWTIETKKKPTKKQLEQMKIGWKFISRIKSNAILMIDKDLPMTRGIGTGQTSRVRSAKIALEQAGKYTKGGILVSDSFFPFDDVVRLAVAHGVGAIVQQGGSVNDTRSIEAADELGIPMVFTHRRAFWH